LQKQTGEFKYQDLIGQFYYRTFLDSDFFNYYSGPTEIDEKYKIYYYKLRRMIENHVFTKKQEEILLLLLGYKQSPLITKNFIGPRRPSEVAKLLKVSKAYITIVIKAIKKRIQNVEEKNRCKKNYRIS